MTAVLTRGRPPRVPIVILSGTVILYGTVVSTVAPAEHDWKLLSNWALILICIGTLHMGGVHTWCWWKEVGRSLVSPAALRGGLPSGVLLGVFLTVGWLAGQSAGVELVTTELNASLWLALLRLFVIASIGTVLFEEVLFRGVLYDCLPHPVALSAVVFGVWHIGPAMSLVDGVEPTPLRTALVIVFVLSVLAVGVYWAWLRRRTGGIGAAFWSHLLVAVLPKLVVAL